MFKDCCLRMVPSLIVFLVFVLIDFFFGNEQRQFSVLHTNLFKVSYGINFFTEKKRLKFIWLSFHFPE